jgi:hypothetical protein
MPVKPGRRAKTVKIILFRPDLLHIRNRWCAGRRLRVASSPGVDTRAIVERFQLAPIPLEQGIERFTEALPGVGTHLIFS